MLSPSLANNRKYAASPVVAGFADSIKNDVVKNEDKYHTNFDALVLAASKKPSVVLESYNLAKIVARMESGTDFFPKGTKKIVAGNCGIRVMPKALKNKIYGISSHVDADVDLNLINLQNTVDIIEHKGSFSYHGVMCCHDIWGCAPCARKISERRKNGLTDLLTVHFDEFGKDTVMASLFTIPHGLGDDLVKIKGGLLDTFRKMTKSGSFTAFMKKLGYCGVSRGLEVTYSLLNGYHPHIHVLHFFEKELSLDDQIDLWNKLFELWTKALLKAGFKAPDRRGFGCQIVANDKKTIADVAEYFSKMESDVNDSDIQSYLKSGKNYNVRSVKNSQGHEVTGWTIEHEMTKWHLKKAKSDGENYRYSMFDFIRGYAAADAVGDEESRKKFRSLWLTYREAFKGSRQLVTRHKHFKIGELDLDDEELGEQAPEEVGAKVVCSIPFDVWLMVVYMGGRGSVLESARIGGADKVEKTLALIRQGYDSLPENRRVLH